MLIAVLESADFEIVQQVKQISRSEFVRFKVHAKLARLRSWADQQTNHKKKEKIVKTSEKENLIRSDRVAKGAFACGQTNGTEYSLVSAFFWKDSFIDFPAR